LRASGPGGHSGNEHLWCGRPEGDDREAYDERTHAQTLRQARRPVHEAIRTPDDRNEADEDGSSCVEQRQDDLAMQSAKA
jgi:hypothetical protein